ncbi:hypothetical protein CDV36_014901 [Fusarium kuroshium]|uniref:F-box domain-containing protein n=1 Tax=Fusarium kuroshium TaxID=2010991 RepID=A0A3M2RE31_9HYPO|nr:hypothetical protein CDV36_014901 [Fusarium kuroshium]
MDNFSQLDSSLPEEPHRPVQHGMLALLPAELLIQTFNHLLDTGDSGRALALTSIKIRNTVIDIFYRQNGKEIFLKGLETADVGILKRCEEFGVASIDYVWEVPLPPFQEGPFKTLWRAESLSYPGSIWNGIRRVVDYHRPVDRLLESAFAGDTIEQKHYDALKWLVYKGHDMSSSNEQLPGKHMVRSLPSQLQRVRDSESMLMLSRMFQLLSSRGFASPYTKYALDKLPENELDPIPNYLIASRDYRGMDSDLNEIRGHLVSLSMRAHCPPSILRTVLMDYEARGVKLSTRYIDLPVALDQYDGVREPDPPPQLQNEGIDTWDPTQWGHICRIEDLLGILHGDRFGLSGWEESYPGEVDDIFSAKVGLLTFYEAITEDEKELLDTILKAMKNITDLQKEGSLTGLSLQKAAWEKLWTAVAPFFEMKPTGLHKLDFEEWDYKTRLHRFATRHSEPYNPWRAWHTQMELQKRREAWGPMSAEDFEKALKKDEEWQQMSSMFRWSVGFEGAEDYDGKPRWYRGGIDEWLSTVERDYPPNVVKRLRKEGKVVRYSDYARLDDVWQGVWQGCLLEKVCCEDGDLDVQEWNHPRQAKPVSVLGLSSGLPRLTIEGLRSTDAWKRQ